MKRVSSVFVDRTPKIESNSIRQKAINDFNKLIYQQEISINLNKLCLCGSNRFEKLTEFDRYGLPFPNQICIDCGLISQVYSISNDTIGLFYDRIYWPLTKGTHDSKNYFTPTVNSDFINFIDEYIDKKKKNIKIFEIGVGTGEKILSLKSHFDSLGINADMYACDYSTDIIKFLKNKKINCVIGGCNALKQFGKADIIILSHVLEHFTDIKKELEVVKDLSDDTTLIYVEVPGVKNLKNNRHYNYDFQDFSVLAHIHNFTLTTLTNTMFINQLYLLKGNEYVRAVFQKKNINNQVSVKNDFSETVVYLNELNNMYMLRVNSVSYKIKQYIKNILTSLFSF